MATYDINAQMTMLEVARRKVGGDPLLIAEILEQTNDAWQDFVWEEANMATAHRVNRRTSLPPGETRKYNAGVGTGASTTEISDEGMAMVEKYAENDKALIDLFDNKETARMQESRAFIEGMGQTFMQLLFKRDAGVNYGSVAIDSSRFNGFPVRLNVLQSNGLVVDAGGSGSDTTSVYFVQWGIGKVYLVHPKGSANVGIEHEDKGVVTVSRATTGSPETNQFEAYRDWFKIHGGLAVHDTRCVARIANIESSGSTNQIDLDLIIDVLTRMPNDGAGAVMYCNQRVRAQLWKIMLSKGNMLLSLDDLFGTKTKVFNILGVPIRRMDTILNTETAIS